MKLDFSEQTLSISCFKAVFHVEVLRELKDLNADVIYQNQAIKLIPTLPSVCFSAQETLLFLPYIRRESKSEFIISLLHKKPVSIQLYRESGFVPLFLQLQDGCLELGNAVVRKCPSAGLPSTAVLWCGAVELQGLGSRWTMTVTHRTSVMH